MAEMWYYTNEGKQMDPVSIKELKRLVGDGTLKPTDMIWKEGMPRWIRASSLKELFPDPMTALDKFFSHTKDDDKKSGTANALAPPISVPGVPSVSSTTATTAAAPKVEDAPQKRKPSTSDADTDDAPVRRRPEPKSGGGGNIFIILFLLFGAFVLLAGLFGGVVLIIVMVKPSGDPKVPIGDDKDKKPDQVPGLDKPVRYEEVIAPGATSPPKKFRFKQGIDYEISARCIPKPPGVAMHIIVREGGKEVKSLRKPGADQYLRWTPRDEGEYTVEFTNFAGGQELKADVTIQESKTDPLEPGAYEGNGTLADKVVNVKPGKDFTGNLRFRVKGGFPAKIAITGQAAGADLRLIVYRDNNPNDIISRDDRPGPNPAVNFTLTKTEYVRIRIQNAGKVASKALITYNVSP